MARLHYNNLQGYLAASPTLTNVATAINFSAALTYNGGVAVPTIVAPDYIPITLDPGTANFEVVSLTAYTSGATSGTIARGVEGAAAAHGASVAFDHSYTVADLTLGAPLDSPALSGTPTAPTPSGTTGIANKAYVDNALAGWDWKQPVAVATSTPVVIAAPGATIDGVTLSPGQRVLLTGQVTASQNGLWVFATLLTPLTRPTDFASGSSQTGAATYVEAGTANAGTQWVLSGASAYTVDTTAQTWALFSAGAGAERTANKGQPSGYAGLDGAGVVPDAQLPTDLIFTDVSIAQVVENTAVPVFTVQPVTSGAPLFQVQENSFPNSGAGAGTYNHTAHFGWNASRVSGGPGTVTGKAALVMGFEDNYFDAAGDGTYGSEWHVDYVTPDGTTIAPGTFRPVYFRVQAADTNTAAKSVTLNFDIGSGSAGQWSVWGSVVSGKQLLSLSQTSFNVNVPFGKFMINSTVVFDLTNDRVALGILTSLPVNSAGAYIGWANGISGIQAGDLLLIPRGSVTGRVRIFACATTTPAEAANFTVAQSTLQGVLALGAGTGTPTAVPRTHNGTSPPTPTVVGNAARFTIGYGTGASPANNDQITVTFPAGAYAAAPVVTLTPLSYDAMQTWLSSVTSTGFIINGIPTGASQAATTYMVGFTVIA
jgi:hypothetical protein